MLGTAARRNRSLPFKELLPRIVVKDPVTHDTWEHGKFTTYLICIKTDHPAFHLQLSAVRRRYSELRWLHKVLKAQYPYAHFPSPPPKKMTAVRFDRSFIEKRMKDIETFLNEMLVIETVLSDTAFHLFLQTDLTTEEMDEYLEGKLSESFLEKAWENAGHLHTSSYVVRMQTVLHEPQEIAMNEEDRQSRGRSSSSSDDSSSELGGESSTQSLHSSAAASPIANQSPDSTSDLANQNGASDSNHINHSAAGDPSPQLTSHKGACYPPLTPVTHDKRGHVPSVSNNMSTPQSLQSVKAGLEMKPVEKNFVM